MAQPVAPTISSQPQTQVATAGANVVIVVVAAGSPTPTFQWQKNGADIVGATTATLNIDNAQYADAARYRVSITNSAGAVTSNEVKLYVGQAGTAYRLTSPVAESTDIEAAVQSEFGSQARIADWNEIKEDFGGNLAAFYQMVGIADGFDVMGTLDGNRYSYQNYDGHRQYFLQRFDSGPYPGFGSHAQTGTLYLGSWYGFSMPVIAIIGAPKITTQPQSQSVTTGSNVVFSVAATGDPSPSFQWRKDGSALSGANGPTLQISNVQPADAARYDVIVSNSVRAVTSSPALLYVGQAGAAYRLTNPITVGNDAAAAVQAQFGGTARVADWNEIKEDFAGNLAAFYEMLGLWNGAKALVTSDGTGSYYSFFYGETFYLALQRDDSGTSGATNFDQTDSLYLRAFSNGQLPVVALIGAPAITTQPLTQVVTTGAAVVFSVVATGDPVPSYQWRKNGVPLPSETNATLVIASAQFADAARYDVIVANAVRTITSSEAKLYVGQAGTTYRLTAPMAATGDIAGAVRAQFGDGASVADWDDIIAIYGGNLPAFYQMLGLADRLAAMVTRTGDRYYNDGNRQYFLQRLDAGPDSSFNVHDQTGTLCLGSWNGFTLPVIAKVTADEAYRIDTLDFRTGSLPQGWTASTGNTGTINYDQRLLASSWNSLNRISRPLAVPPASPQLEISFRGTIPDGYLDYVGGNYVVLTLAGGDELKFSHGYFAAQVSLAGAVLKDKSLSGAAGLFEYTITLRDGTISHRAVGSNGVVLFDYTVTVPSLLLANIEQVDLAVFNGQTAGSAMIDDVRVTVFGTGLTVAPAPTSQPQNQKVFVGDGATFGVTATGGPAPTYQWQVSTDGGASWANIANGAVYAGTDTATLTVIAATAEMDGYLFRVLISNAVQSDVQTGAAGLQVAVDYTFSTLAGAAGVQGTDDGTGIGARFYYPAGLVVDEAGSLYVGDHVYGTIRKITENEVTTFATGLSNPDGLALDHSGNLYVANYGNNTIQKISSAGVVTTLAGNGGTGSADGVGSAAQFNHPSGVALDGAGNAYVADQWNHTIRKITLEGVVTTLSGSAGSAGTADGLGSAARFTYPYDLAVDNLGNVYVADTSNHTIRKITSSGLVSTLAGSPGSAGSVDGVGGNARFNQPWGIGTDSQGNLFVAERNNHTIRKVTRNGVVSTIAGLAGNAGIADGLGEVARFNYPKDVAVDIAGNLYVADMYNNTIRSAAPAPPALASAAAASGVVGTQFEYLAVFHGALTGFYANGLPAGLTMDAATGAITGIPSIAGSFAVTLSATNGAGTGESSLTLTISPANQHIMFAALEDKNLGDDAFALTATASSGLPVTYEIVSGPATLGGNEITLTGAGTVMVRASQTGNANYNPAPTVEQSFAVTANPKAVVSGLNKVIASGAIAPAVTDGTDFGSATLGVGATNVIHFFAITNPGPVTLHLVGVPAIAISGPAASDFIVTTQPATSVAIGGGTTQFSLKFSPTEIGAREATVTIASDDPATPSYTFAILGTGMDPAPHIALSGAGGAPIGYGDSTPSVADRTDFGSATVGLDDAAQEQTFTVTNAGTLPLNLTGTPRVSISGSHAQDFIVTLQPAGTLNPGVVSAIAIKFSPTGAGTRNAWVSISSNDTEKPTFTFAISGLGASPQYIFSTLAGTAGVAGSTNGTGSAALFSGPQGLVVDDAGTVYVSDFNQIVRKITNGGDVSSLAGGSGMFYADGTGSAAGFQWPGGLALDAAGNVIVADSGNNVIRKITPDGVVTTLAGNPGHFMGGFADGNGIDAEFRWPSDVAVDGDGIVFVADTDNGMIRRIDADGNVTTLPYSVGAGRLALDANGNIFTTDYNAGTIKKVTSTGEVSTLGSASIPAGLAVDNVGNVFVADRGNHTILKITPDGTISTIGGLADNPGSADGTGDAARFFRPWAIAVDRTGNLYVADYTNNTIRWGSIAPPALTSSRAVTATIGNPISYLATFARALTGIHASGLPAGLNIDTASGAILGRPSVAGTFPVILSATNGAGTGTGTLTITITGNFSSWQSSKFTESELSDPGLSGPNAVYGADGLPNLVKYALGLEPKQDVTSGLPSISIDGAEWVYTYTRPTDRPDISYAVEVSTNLLDWTTASVIHEHVSTASSSETWRGRYPVSSTPNIFFRLRVSRL